MLSDWLPRSCSRLKIFLSYSSEQSPTAETIAQTLMNNGHTVFFDKKSLPAGADYNEQIRKGIISSNLFLFLASRSALENGRYTRTELDFAQKQWPSPVGRVFTIIIDPELKHQDLPPYLAAMQNLSIKGNAVAEISATIERNRRVNSTGLAFLGAAAVTLAGVVWLAVVGLFLAPGFRPSDIEIVAPEYVHFRSRAKPPDDPSAPGAAVGWIDTPLTITLPIAYSYRNTQSAPAQLLNEEVELELGQRKEKYSWTYVVEIVGSSVSDKRCGEDWLCQKGNVKAENLKPGDTTATRETMFLSAAGVPLLWKDFIDKVLSEDGPGIAKVILQSKIIVADGSAKSDTGKKFECVIDVEASRQRMIAAGFKAGHDPRPTTWQPRCQNKL